MRDTGKSRYWKLVLSELAGTDMSDTRQKTRDEMLTLISESMEVRMQSLEGLCQLESTMQAIEQFCADSYSWPLKHADGLDKQFL